jgi:putative transposase
MPDFAALLAAAEDEEMTARLRRAESIGRPIGSSAFLEALEKDYDRRLATGAPGRPRREKMCALSP